ncbi:MAG TPA: aldo/keto reductase [Bryobacteraceae bacterium]|nr:aldo/keto reductase [Bryobacteraceae bacterium]
MIPANVQLGLGLIGIGKPWGHVPKPVPEERDAVRLLEFAFELGIRYFDTAPSYGDGLSERRLGFFLKSLTSVQRNEVTVATKFGEHWDARTNEPYADHGYDALKRSLDASLARLGGIDTLQLHKTTPQALASGDVAKAWDYATTTGIHRFGPSASDLESARLALENPHYSVLQIPCNAANPKFAPVLDAAGEQGIWVAVNRPFAMGAMVHEGTGKVPAFRFILRHRFTGVILTGTTSPAHLRENWQAFREATAG